MWILRQVGLLSALLLTCIAAGAQNPRNPHSLTGTFHTAIAVHSLAPEDAARGYPVHLRATVTYYDPFIDARHGALFVHDATGSIFVALPSRPILPIRAGSVVDVAGVSGAGDYAPIVDRARVIVVGKSEVPKDAPRVAMQQLLSGKVDGQWVEVEGVVQSVHLADKDVTLEIKTIEGPLSATTIIEAGVDYGALVDASVRLHGNNGPVFNKKRQLVGVHLFFPSLSEVKVLRPAPVHPFAMPEGSMSQLLRFTPGLELAHRVRIRGRVTLQWPGRLLCLQKGNDALCMQSTETTPVRRGDLVDVIGFPAISQYKATLENATFRFVSHDDTDLQAKPSWPDLAARGEQDGQLIRIEGELIGQDRATGDLTLMLRSDRFLYPAILPHDAVHSLAPLRDGSQLRLTGICSVQVDPESTNQGEGEVRSRSVQILLRSAEDVEVLKAPSWWTPGNALSVLSAVALVAFAAFTWVFVLRRRVEQQTRALRTSEERLRHLSHHDALTGLPNRILLSDRLDVALDRVDRFKSKVGVLMVDLDGFKAVNDKLGHFAGDQLLCQVASRIQRSVRKTDTVARIGGDEFVVLLPDLDSPEQSESIAQKIIGAVSESIDIESTLVSVTVSVGVCTYPEGGEDAETLLKHADAAMYCAKSNGRNGWQVYNPGGAPNLPSQPRISAGSPHSAYGIS